MVKFKSMAQVQHQISLQRAAAARTRALRSRPIAAIQSAARRISGLNPPIGVMNEPLPAPGRTVYVYASSSNIQMSNGGGAVIRSARLEVLFWGDQWQQPGMQPSAGNLADAITAILSTPYLSEMDQYGFGQLEEVGFSQVVGSNPPGGSYTGHDVKNLIDDLMGSGVFPEPDEPGGRIIYMVFPQSGTAYSSEDEPAAGGHGPEVDIDSPFDVDYAWVAWVNFDRSIDSMTSVFTHELVEAISDPELNAWRTNDPDFTEIGDICQLQNGPVADFAAAAYYSARLGRCVVPSDGLHRQLRISQIEQGLGTVFESQGATRAEPGKRCFSGSYRWNLVSRAMQVICKADVTSYVNPNVQWMVDGKNANATSSVDEQVDLTQDPLCEIAPSALQPEVVAVGVQVGNDGTELTLVCPADAGAVRVNVVCTVEDSGFLGYATKRSLAFNVYLKGSTRSMEERVRKDRESCWLGSIDQLNQIVVQLLPFINTGDPFPGWTQAAVVEFSDSLHTAVSEGRDLLDALRIGVGPALR